MDIPNRKRQLEFYTHALPEETLMAAGRTMASHSSSSVLLVAIFGVCAALCSFLINKKRRPTHSGPRFRLYYWPGFPGRGEFMRLLFAETATAFDDVYAQLTFEEATRSCYGHPERFAAPAIGDLERLTDNPSRPGPLALSQTTVIMRYLASELDGGRLQPASEAEQLRAAVLMSDVADAMEEGCRAWHATDYNKGYEEQAEATRPFVDSFVERRLPKWLSHFDRALQRGGKGGRFLVGGRLSYADLALFHLLDGMRSESSAGGGCRRKYEEHASDALKAFVAEVEGRPRIRAWLDGPRRCKFTMTGPGF